MSTGSYMQVHVLCPYYRKDDGKNKITCEGITDTCVLDLRFTTRAEMHKQAQIFCTKHYKKCEIYRMLEEKHSE